MADEQGNNPDENGPSASPFARPAFLVSAGLVALIVVLAAILGVRIASSRSDAASPAASPSATSSSAPSVTDPAASICGLTGPSDPGPLTVAPAAAWQYEGATAYPTSPEFGPGKNADVGYRFCFQHSQAGAVFAAANAIAVPEDDAARQSWVEYFVSSGPNRSGLLKDLGGEPSSDPTGIRVQIVGFKVLSYTDSAARIDIGVEASGSAQSVMGSYVYELTWQDGDWKLNSDAPTPFNFSTVQSTAGYVPWSP